MAPEAEVVVTAVEVKMADEATNPTAVVATAAETKTKIKALGLVLEGSVDQDTPPHLLRPVVTAITSMELRLGTVRDP